MNIVARLMIMALVMMLARAERATVAPLRRADGGRDVRLIREWRRTRRQMP